MNGCISREYGDHFIFRMNVLHEKFYFFLIIHELISVLYMNGCWIWNRAYHHHHHLRRIKIRCLIINLYIVLLCLFSRSLWFFFHPFVHSFNTFRRLTTTWNLLILCMWWMNEWMDARKKFLDIITDVCLLFALK